MVTTQHILRLIKSNLILCSISSLDLDYPKWLYDCQSSILYRFVKVLKRKGRELKDLNPYITLHKQCSVNVWLFSNHRENKVRFSIKFCLRSNDFIKSGLWYFVLEISRRTMPHDPVDQLTLIAIKSRHWLKTIYCFPRGR